MEQESLLAINQALRKAMVNLQEQAILKRQIQTYTQDLIESETSLSQLVIQLHKEEKDVEKLQSLSFSHLFYSMINQKTEKLNQEEIEVLEVKNQIDEAQSSIVFYKQKIEELTANLMDDQGLDREYGLCVQRKKTYIEQYMPSLWHELSAMDEENAHHERMIMELKEADQAEQVAENQVDKVIKILRSAAGWGTMDIIGGGLLTTMAKHSEMDKAQAAMQSLKLDLKKLSRELEDVGSDISFDIGMDDFLNFADYFFDGLLVDFSVQSKINQSQDQMLMLKNKLRNIHDQVKSSYQDRISEIEKNNAKIEKMIERT